MTAIKYSLLCGMAALSLFAAGCTRAQAKVVPELPPLDVPAPPPRHVEAAEVEPPPPPPPPEDPAPPPPTRPRPAPAVQQQRPEPKPEPPRVEVPAPTELKPAEESRTTPPGTLQTQPVGREAQLEKKINDMLSRAGTNLNRVDYGGLNADARTQYDQAKRFISQAQEALHAKNLVFAENLADKANTLAAQLSGR
jgi:outer membrane biosynthesis protein TonB